MNLIKDLFSYFYFFNMDICRAMSKIHTLNLIYGLITLNVIKPYIRFKVKFYPEGTQFLMRWIFMYKVLKGCKPSHSNEPVHFWIDFGLFLIGGSGLYP